MTNHSLQHDAALALVVALLGAIRQDVPDERRQELVGEFYRAAMTALERYEEKAERRERRLRPNGG